MMSIKEKQQELIDDFAFLSDWEQKYEYIIDLGKELKGLPEEKKNEDILIKGCQSQVWLDAELRDGKIFFLADSDGILPKDIISLLVECTTDILPKKFWRLILILFPKSDCRNSSLLPERMDLPL